MSDWIEHNGGPQPVADDVWVEVSWPFPSGGVYLSEDADEFDAASEIPWRDKCRYRILNQHLIDAARLEGIRLGLEAAAGEGAKWFGPLSYGAQEILANIRNLDPDTIAREAQDMGSEKETT